MDVPKAQKMMEWNFDFGSSFGLTAQNGPKLENCTFPTLFELGPSSLRVSWTYPRPKKWLSEIPKKMERNLDFWSRFGLMAQLAQNGPKLENWTPTTALDIGSSSLWGSWTYRRPRKWRSEISILGPNGCVALQYTRCEPLNCEQGANASLWHYIMAV